ncbi:hypothetical protein P4308_27235, partial [Bacillus wiedmannii]|uniref:hypothetical protein n=1 Tax=Bacillus wiedmannii TaxID=1890302 RepID=UPI002E1CD322|nr:hypothetical protein [Bacillus wiedmannii]
DASFDYVIRKSDSVNADSVARDINFSNVIDRVNAESVDRDSCLQRSLDTFADEVRSRLSALESKVK